MKGKVKRFFKGERGTQTIEFALAFPFLLFLFVSAVEMARMFKTYTTLQKATEVGARYLSTAPVSGGTYASSDTTTATNLIVCGNASSCSGQDPVVAGLTSSNVTITPPGTSNGTRYVTVKVTYAYSPFAFDNPNMSYWGFSLNFTFTPTITMRYMLVT